MLSSLFGTAKSSEQTAVPPGHTQNSLLPPSSDKTPSTSAASAAAAPEPTTTAETKPDPPPPDPPSKPKVVADQKTTEQPAPEPNMSVGGNKENMKPEAKSTGNGDDSAKTSSPTTPTVIGVSKVRTKRTNTTSLQSLKRFGDFGEFGFYEGQLNDAGQRHGNGKMFYDSGNYYEGTFVNDKFQGESGLYRWFDGDEQEGAWLEGERHGTSVFRSAADGSVEYSTYEKGKAVGEGLWWSADRKTAQKLKDGKKMTEMSLDLAEQKAKEMFDLPVPGPSTIVLSPLSVTVDVDVADESSSSRSMGIIGRLFSSRGTGPDGKPMFKDYGDWGTYEGLLDSDGNREGEGKMTYESGNTYEGGFVNDKFEGPKGKYLWADGDEYEGAWKDGERNGIGIFRTADGTVDYSVYDKGAHSGEGVSWSADRKTAHKTENGKNKMEVSLAVAEKLAREKFELPVPEPASESSKVVPPKASAGSGILGSLFAKKRVGPDGKMQFKEYGEWGSYDGEFNSAGERHGQGKITYDSGNYYEGEFVNDKFEGENGLYQWMDGDSYKGSWKEGERHGVGIFTSADGTVEYSQYEKGAAKGDGVVWSPDRKTAHKSVDGQKKHEMTIEEAESFAKEKFGLPIPEPSAKAPAQTEATPSSSKSPGILGRLFAKRKVGPDGKEQFKDYGEWGSYDGEFNASGERHGKGKMTYDSGNYYEGEFVNDQFQGEKGLYHWQDGDEYVGSWEKGERHGVGIFRLANGTVEYSNYDKGSQTGEGLTWSADRKTAHKMVNGKKTSEISVAMSEKLAKDKFDLPVPEPSSTAAPEVASVPASSKSVGFLGRLFSGSKSKVGPDGKMQFKDHGDWGSFDGNIDSDGKRQGKGKMTYDSGNYYEGNFVDDKFQGDGEYRWVDGDSYKGSWKEGERNGVGIFLSADGVAEYSMYENGAAKGDGLWWSADRKTVHKTADGKKGMEMLIEEAESFAKEKFDLPVPEASAVVVSPTPTLAPEKKSFFGGLFQSKQEGVPGPDGKLQFKDNGEWGSYDGEFDTTGKRRHGKGEMKYDSGNCYKGSFVENKYQGHGVYLWNDGDEYEGAWEDGERNGIGIFRLADGSVEYSLYEKGNAMGEGVAWDADRKTAHKIVDGVKKSEISLAMGEKVAQDKFNLPVPAPHTKKSSNSEPKPSLLGRLFQSKQTGVGPALKDGPRFEDYGDMGTYDGDLENGLRQGEGKMSYDSGNIYEGDFSNNKFDGNRGLYRWSDGTEYEGSWKQGVFNGIGVYRTPGVGVDYSMYKDGFAVGVGISWNADYSKAYFLLDGVTMNEAPLVDADHLAKNKFGLPSPSTKPQLGSTSRFGWLFGRERIGPDGKPMFRDHGDWGSYIGGFNADGKRHGQGKMTYESGNTYEGGFVNDQFQGPNGKYCWADGDEYEGAWEDGERNGIGIFRSADGTVEYAMYKNGAAKGDGVSWTADRKSSHKTLDGEKKHEILVEEAESFAKEKFDLAVPEPSNVTLSQPVNVPESVKNVGLLGRLFAKKKMGPDGKMQFKEYGEWGSYDGEFNSAGERHGQGKITYDSGNYYEGEFVNDKFQGRGVYCWTDGDKYDGSWKEGERNGVGIFRSADGTVEYSTYETGAAKGDGVVWSPDRKTAHKTVDGEKKHEILIEEAESFAKEKFDLPAPEPAP